jgi:drug/metabolite transporter (DMT)-like permease
MLPKPRPLIGVALMLAAMASLPCIDVLAKFLGQQNVPILQIVWARLTFGAAITLPFALRHTTPRGLFPARPIYHAFRAAFLILATFTFFLSLKFLPIADALAIFFVQPLVLTVLSALVLKEHVGPRRWGAVCVGFIGTLIIIRPGFAEVNPGSLLALGAGTFLAIYFVMTRRIAGQSAAMLTTFQTNAVGAALITLAMPLIWHTPTPSQWLMFAGLGTIASFGHFLIVRAYDFAEASLLAPLAYTEMIMATVLGWWFFGDFPDVWTFTGVAILIACAFYISVRERARHDPAADFEQP